MRQLHAGQVNAVHALAEHRPLQPGALATFAMMNINSQRRAVATASSGFRKSPSSG